MLTHRQVPHLDESVQHAAVEIVAVNTDTVEQTSGVEFSRRHVPGVPEPVVQGVPKKVPLLQPKNFRHFVFRNY